MTKSFRRIATAVFGAGGSRGPERAQRGRAVGFSLATAAYWIERTRGQRLDRVDFANRKPGRAWNRSGVDLEQRILSLRFELREHSVLGEYGLDAITATLREQTGSSPSRATIHRVLERHGVFDAVHRARRPAPPKGWYLPNVASHQAELDSFDFIEDLKIADGPLVAVLTATSLHGALADAWVMPQRSAQGTVVRCCRAGASSACPPTRSSTTTPCSRARITSPMRWAG